MKRAIKYSIGYILFLLDMRNSLSDLVALEKIKRKKRFEDGILKTSNFVIKYSDGPSLYHQYIDIVQKRIYDFTPKKESGKIKIIDCGANLGLGSLFLKKRYPDSQITAFEPNPYIFEFLKENTKNTDIILEQKAIWNISGEIKMSLDKADASSISFNKQGNVVKVPCIKLSECISDNIIDFLKIDVEGAEYEIIKEAKGQLKNVNNIFIEYHNSDLENTKLIEILSILKESGFKCYLKSQSSPNTPLVNREHKTSDFFYQMNIFGFK